MLYNRGVLEVGQYGIKKAVHFRNEILKSYSLMSIPEKSPQKISLCSGYGRREAVEILLNAGANVHARDDGD